MRLVPFEGGVLLDSEAGRYAVRGGCEIFYDPAEGASARNVRLYLLGSAFGALLHQRGILPLHANAVALDGQVHAFLGHPGAGKATLAAAFHDRGYRLLSDDVCAVRLDAQDRPWVEPGMPRLRLWRS